MLQVLLYDDEEMHIYEVVNYRPYQAECTEYGIMGFGNDIKKTMIIPNSTYIAELTVGEVKAELDPTTMMRIAKYNFGKEFKEINEQIKSANRQLKALQEEILVKERKLSTINDVVKHIWEDECFDEEDYLFDKSEED